MPTKKPLIFLILFLLYVPLYAKTLTVYTYDSFTAEWGPGPKLATLFAEQCGCTVEFKGLQDGGAILTRLKIEGDDTPADVVVGIDNSMMDETDELGIFSPHGISPEVLDALPVEWNHKKLLPYDYGWFAFVYNSEKIKHPPKRLSDLVDSNNATPTIILQDPRISTPGMGFLLWMKTIYGSAGGRAWNALSKRIVTVTPGWSEAYSLFLKGEADMVLSYTTSPAYHIIAENDQRYKSILFDEGNYLQIELAGLLRSSKNKRLAKRFLRFLVGTQAQEVIPTTQWMFPVKNVTLPKRFPDRAAVKKSLTYPKRLTAKERKILLREWLANIKK